MKIIACCKASPDDQDITATPDRKLSLEKASMKWGAYDLNAVEAGKRLVESAGGTLVGATVGAKAIDAPKLAKDIISRGLDELILAADDGYAGIDSYQTAKVLNALIGKIGEFDLILCGAGSSDSYSQQVGNILGAMKGLPTLNAVSSIELGEGMVTVERTLEGEVQVLDVPLPAVISVTSGINEPRIPGMKDILAAGKKPANAFTKAELGQEDAVPSAVEISTLAPEQKDRALDVVEGEDEEAVAKLASAIAAAL